MKHITFLFCVLCATTISAQKDTLQNKKVPVILDCERLYPERTLNHDPINPDFYTYDHSGAKERCIEKNAATYANSISSDTSLHEYLLMKGGKMVFASKEGNTNQLNKNFTLSDGSIVISNGTVIRKDGTKLLLKETDFIYISGEIVKGKSK